MNFFRRPEDVLKTSVPTGVNLNILNFMLVFLSAVKKIVIAEEVLRCSGIL